MTLPDNSPSAWTFRDTLAALGWFVLAIVARSLRLSRVENVLDHDQAIVGLMALDISEGRRWPKTQGHSPQTVWRLSVSFWRVAGAAELADQARQARRALRGKRLDAEALRELSRQPLRPVRPQQPLDTGLFEAPAPEAPHILIPDE